MAKISSLCVYCGSSRQVPSSHIRVAEQLGELLANNGVRLVYGGGRVGVMGVLADAALAAGGEVVGIIPRFLDEYEVGHNGVTRLEITESMHERKQLMAELSDGFAVLPGGLGTLDEMFEMVTWKQLHLHDKPIVLVDVAEYWQPLLTLISHIVDTGYARPENEQLFKVVENVDQILPALERLPQAQSPPQMKWL